MAKHSSSTPKSTSTKEKGKGKGKQVVAPAPVPSSSSSSSSSSSASSDSSDSSDESSDSEPEQQKQIPTPRKAHAKFQPPKGMKVVMGKDLGDLDWDEVNNDKDLELWAIKVPVGIKPRHLENLTIELSSRPHSQPIGHFKAKKSEFDIFQARAKEGMREGDEDIEEEGLGAAEMHEFVPLLAKKSAGDKLFQAPRPITRNLIVARSLPSSVLSHLPSSTSSLIASQPSPVPGATLSASDLLDPEIVAQKKQKRSQPEGIALKFRLKVGGQGPVGGRGNYHNPPEKPEVGDETMMDVDDEDVEPEQEVDEKEEKRLRKEAKKAKKEKRQSLASVADDDGGEESPKKKRRKVKAEE